MVVAASSTRIPRLAARGDYAMQTDGSMEEDPREHDRQIGSTSARHSEEVWRRAGGGGSPPTEQFHYTPSVQIRDAADVASYVARWELDGQHRPQRRIPCVGNSKGASEILCLQHSGTAYDRIGTAIRLEFEPVRVHKIHARSGEALEGDGSLHSALSRRLPVIRADERAGHVGVERVHQSSTTVGSPSQRSKVSAHTNPIYRTSGFGDRYTPGGVRSATAPLARRSDAGEGSHQPCEDSSALGLSSQTGKLGGDDPIHATGYERLWLPDSQSIRRVANEAQLVRRREIVYTCNERRCLDYRHGQTPPSDGRHLENPNQLHLDNGRFQFGLGCRFEDGQRLFRDGRARNLVSSAAGIPDFLEGTAGGIIVSTDLSQYLTRLSNPFAHRQHGCQSSDVSLDQPFPVGDGSGARYLSRSSSESGTHCGDIFRAVTGEYCRRSVENFRSRQLESIPQVGVVRPTSLGDSRDRSVRRRQEHNLQEIQRAMVVPQRGSIGWFGAVLASELQLGESSMAPRGAGIEETRTRTHGFGNHRGPLLAGSELVSAVEAVGVGRRGTAAGGWHFFSRAAAQTRNANFPQSSLEGAPGIHSTTLAVKDLEVVRMLTSSSLKSSTWQQYSKTWNIFFSFCVNRELCPLPASMRTLIQYLGFLLHSDQVHGKSLDAHVSAINKMHVIMGHNAPAQGPFWRVLYKGFVLKTLHAVGPIRSTRVPLPAFVMFRVVQFLLSHEQRKMVLGLRRRLTALLHGFLFFERSSSVFRVQCGDIALHDGVLSYTQRYVKGETALSERRVFTVPAPVKGWLWCIFGRLLHLMRHQQRSALLYYDDYVPCSSWMEDNITLLFHLLHLTPHAGTSWLGHSLRSGGATAAYACNVPVPVIARWGGWSPSTNVVDRYIRVSEESFDKANFFFFFLKRFG